MFRDLGMVDHDEPFQHLLTQGMVLKEGAVMSKSKGNVVDPDEMMQKFGADALRLYVMFVAPPEKEVEWSDCRPRGQLALSGARSGGLSISGATASRTLRRSAASMPRTLDAAERQLRRKTHETIDRVTVDVEQRIHLNTAVSALMELVNELYAFGDAALKAADARPQSACCRCAKRSKRW